MNRASQDVAKTIAVRTQYLQKMGVSTRWLKEWTKTEGRCKNWLSRQKLRNLLVTNYDGETIAAHPVGCPSHGSARSPARHREKARRQAEAIRSAAARNRFRVPPFLVELSSGKELT